MNPKGIVSVVFIATNLTAIRLGSESSVGVQIKFVDKKCVIADSRIYTM